MEKGIKTYKHKYQHYQFELEIPLNEDVEDHESEQQKRHID